MPVSIYTLSDPRTQNVHYVGQTRYALVNRLLKHISDSYRESNNKKDKWIANLIADGTYPIITEIEVCTEENAYEREEHWIREYLARGSYLYNTILIPSPRNKNTTPKKKNKLAQARRMYFMADGQLPRGREQIRKEYKQIRFTGSNGSNSDLIYQWLVENDPGWTKDEVPTARTILRETDMDGLISTSSAQRGMTRFIRDFKS